MKEIIDCFKNYTMNEGYRIKYSEDGKGELILDSDIHGLFEYKQPFENEKQLKDMILQERINGTSAIVYAVTQELANDRLVDSGDMDIKVFQKEIRKLAMEMGDIIFQLQLIDYELEEELKQEVAYDG